MEKISIIAPCLNEEKNIMLFFDELKEIFSDKYKYELIFVNDGSVDDTLIQMKEVAKTKLCNVKIIDFSRNFGKESGIYAGLKNCTGDYAVILDSDLQQDPKLIIKMLCEIETKNCDGVTFYQSRRKENDLLAFFKKSFYKLINSMSNVRFYENASDFRLINRKMIDAYLSLKEQNRFAKGIFAFIGFNQVYLPYVVQPRINGKTKWNFKKLFNYALDGIVSFTRIPIIICKIVRYILLIAIITLFIFSIIYQTLFANVILFVVLAIAYLIMVVLSVFARYLCLMYEEVKNRPIYVAKDMYDNDK